MKITITEDLRAELDKFSPEQEREKKEAEVFNSAEFEETYIFFCDFLGAEKHNAGKISIKQKKKSFFIKFSK